MVRAADALIAIGGAYGTLSEIAFALKAGKRVVGLGTWDVDGVEAADSPEAAVETVLRRPQHLDSLPSWPASRTPPTSTRCARTPRANPVASTCPATRAARRRPRPRGGVRRAHLRPGHPALTYGIDVGDEPTPFLEAQGLAADAWGARRTWWLVNGASRGNHALLARAPRTARRHSAERPLEHDRRADHVRPAADDSLA